MPSAPRKMAASSSAAGRQSVGEEFLESRIQQAADKTSDARRWPGMACGCAPTPRLSSPQSDRGSQERGTSKPVMTASPPASGMGSA